MAKIDRAAKVRLLADFDAQYAAFVTAGMDEAGRGPLVGNVVAACVVMPKGPLILWVDGSKKLREAPAKASMPKSWSRRCMSASVEATPEEIDHEHHSKRQRRRCARSRQPGYRGVPHRRGEVWE